MNTLQLGQVRLRLNGAVTRALNISTSVPTTVEKQMGGKLFKVVRRNATLPSELRPEVGKQSLDVQIAAVWKAFAVYTGRSTRAAQTNAEVDRFRSILYFYEELEQAGVRLTHVEGLKERHARVLLEYWRKAGKADATIRKNWSILRIWAQALGKPNMIGKLETYWPQAPKTWIDANKPTGAKWALLTEQQMTELMRAGDQTHWYVERLIEAFQVIMLHPIRDIQLEQGLLQVRVGAKGGRPRIVPIEVEWQRAVATALCEFVRARNVQRIRDESDYFPLAEPNLSLEQAISHYRDMLTKHRVTKKHLGVTGHGLRAGYVCRRLTELGIVPVVKGGDGVHPDKLLDEQAHRLVSESVGHSRKNVIGAYAGSAHVKTRVHAHEFMKAQGWMLPGRDPQSVKENAKRLDAYLANPQSFSPIPKGFLMDGRPVEVFWIVEQSFLKED